MDPDSATRGTLPAWAFDALWIVASTVAGTSIVFLAWDASLDPITDTGRDFYIPEQIRGGAKLYRDILYYYPPLTPYLLAFVTAVMGSDLTSYQILGTVVAVLTSALVYTLARMAGNRHAAGAALLLFVSGSVYSISGRTMNYLIPYAYASTLGMLFFLAGGAFLYRHIAGRRTVASLVAALAMFLLASWTKIEYSAFSVVVLVAAAIVFSIRLRWVLLYVLAGVVTVVLAGLYFSDAVPERHWLWQNILAPSLLRGEPARHFYRLVSGLNAPLSNLMPAVAGAILTIVLVLLLRFVDRRKQPLLTAAVAAVMAGAAFFGGVALIRGWALLQIAMLPVAVRRRDPILIVILLSLCASSRVLLRLFPSWYGFVYVIPSLVLVASVLFDWLPRFGVYSARAALLWIVAVIGIAWQLLHAEAKLLARAEYPVETVRGRFFETNRDRALILNAFIDDVAKRRPASLVVVPEGLTLNYLTNVPTPLSFYTFTPAETAERDVEQRIIREMTQSPPEVIAVVTRSVSDFGYRAFGSDYNRDLAAHIRQRYYVDREWRLPGFELILLRRAAVLSSPP